MASSKQRYVQFRRDARASRTQPMEGNGRAPAANGGLPDDRGKRGGYFREYLAWLRPFVRTIVLVFVLALVAALLGLVLPRATMYIIDIVLPRRDVHTLHAVGFGLLALIFVQQCIELYRNWHLARLNARVVFRVRQRLYNHLLRLPLHELSEMKSGGITSRLSGDVDAVSGLVQMALISPAVAAVRIVFTLAMLLWINWQMAVAAAVLLPPVVGLNLIYIRRIRPIYRSMRRDRQEIDGRVVETFGGIRVVRAFRREWTEAKEYAARHHTVIRKELLARFLEYVVWSGWGFLLPLCGLIVIWVGALLVLGGRATVGGILAFQMYLFMLLAPVSTLVQSYGQTQQGLAAMERVFDILRRSIDKPDRPGAIRAPTHVQTLAFDHVAFAYHQGKRVLHDVSLRVNGGATVALVGPSGSGKTTITNLVARFYDPTEGAIRLNGTDLRDLQTQSYRELLAIVPQDTFLFDGTIAANIAYGRKDATREQIQQAARRANAHDFILSFPAGYETVVGERGVRLSGGQAQRISIARAILADPRILILDEATSNLDSESEQLIRASLRELLTDRTTFVIAHRLSTVTHADLIVVLEQGRIVETGTHLELLARDGLYRAMVARQQRGVLTAEPASAGAETADWLR
jgi:ATP-binding cassette subfamily B protein/subfamily B ATP-binding cassette protein MsbA